MIGGLEVSLHSKGCPWRGLVPPCICVTYRDVSDEWLGGIGQHRGGPHHCVARAHGLHIHVR